MTSALAAEDPAAAGTTTTTADAAEMPGMTADAAETQGMTADAAAAGMPGTMIPAWREGLILSLRRAVPAGVKKKNREVFPEIRKMTPLRKRRGYL